MACCCAKKGGAANDCAADETRKILAALAEMAGPASSQEIARASGLDGKSVSVAIKALKARGLVDSPVRCKYGLTEAGRKEELAV